jgi:FkbH-like protein
LLIADFTIDNFSALVGKRSPLHVTVAPIDRVEPVLLGHDEAPWQANPEWAMVWTRPQRMIPAFARRMGFEEVATSHILEEVDTFAQRLIAAAVRVRGLFVATWVTGPTHRGLGLLDMDPAKGTAAALLAMNQRLAEALAAAPGVHLLDAQRWVALGGRSALSPKLWYLSKTPFSLPVFEAAAADVVSAIAAVRGEARKLVVLDLDDTLWGGLVGEDGWENLRLGGHDPIGEALADFQHALKALTRRGVLLAVVSKNDEAVALEAIRRHPEMVLRETDFVGWRINWGDKAANIAELADELNLGLHSVVVIDDNPHERARVRAALPEVFVPEWPRDKMLYRTALEELACFDAPALTGEDRVRGQLYGAERRRRELQRALPTVDEFLAGLGIHVTIEPYRSATAARITQLINRTSQMNLQTRRLTNAELGAWIDPSRRRLWAFRVHDRFGDAGICGVLGLELDGDRASVTDFVMSCRVLGRKVEDVMLRAAVDAARAAGAIRLEARYHPTTRNHLCLEFFDRCGFHRDDHVFSWNTAESYPVPEYLTVEYRESAAEP